MGHSDSLDSAKPSILVNSTKGLLAICFCSFFFSLNEVIVDVFFTTEHLDKRRAHSLQLFHDMTCYIVSDPLSASLLLPSSFPFSLPWSQAVLSMTCCLSVSQPMSSAPASHEVMERSWLGRACSVRMSPSPQDSEKPHGGRQVRKGPGIGVFAALKARGNGQHQQQRKTTKEKISEATTETQMA